MIRFILQKKKMKSRWKKCCRVGVETILQVHWYMRKPAHHGECSDCSVFDRI